MMSDLLRVLSLAKRHGAWFLLALMSMVVVAGATVFTFNLVRPIFDQVLGSSSTSRAALDLPTSGVVAALDSIVVRAQHALQGWVGENRMAILLLAFLAIGVKNLFAFLARFASARFGLATIRDLRNLFFQSLLVQSPTFFHDRSTAALASRATNDFQLLREALAERLGDVVQDLVTVPVVLVFLASLDLRLTLATALFAPLLFAPVIHFSRRLRGHALQAQERTDDVAVAIDETVRGIRVVQTFGMAEFMAERFHSANRRQYRAGLAARAIQAANAPVMEVVGVFAALVVIAYAASQITAGDITLGDLSAFVLGTYALYNPFKRLNKFNLVLQPAVVASRRIFEVIDAPVAILEQPGARVLTDVDAGVRFENVGFAYRQDQWVLRGFDLHLAKGSTVALVGASGAGKSTAVQLMPRFIDVQEGAVIVAGHDVRSLTLASLRAQIGLVTQEPLLFNDTVWTNIVCGREDLPIDAVEAAASAADADEFIRGLPSGYDTVIGEGGVKLSGGQRQRLAIARAVLQNPPILILDEATSALDSESETVIQRALDRFARDRTTLIVAHRLATIRRADVIAVLANGRIAEMGNHDELIAAAGLYRRMVEMQEFTEK
jgi:subfamily B ATP-binding cassette protein MsbA